MSAINNGINNMLGNPSGTGPAGSGMMMNGNGVAGTADQITTAVNLKNSSLVTTAASTGKLILTHYLIGKYQSFHERNGEVKTLIHTI